MKSLTSFFSFSTRRSALVLGTTLGASLLFAGATFAQLNIPSDISNTAITIKRIFLSPLGTSLGQDATIQLDGTNGTINVTSAGTLGGNAGIDTPRLDTRNLTVRNSVFFQGMNCNNMVANPGGLGGIEVVEGEISLGGRTTAGKEKEGGGPIIVPPMTNPKCFLMVDASGEVTIIPDFREDAETGGSNAPVFKRNSDNSADSYFANEDGEPSEVNKSNFLRIGTTNGNVTEAYNNDTAMVVGGSIESRGGNFIRKIDGIAANEGGNLKVNFEQFDDHTSLSNTVEEGMVYFQSMHKAGANLTDTKFSFTALGGKGGKKTSIGINTYDPLKTLDVNGNAAVTQYLTVGHPSSFVPTTTDKLFVNGTTRANAYYYNSDARYKANIAIVPNALEKLSALHGYSYYNKLTQKNDVGVIAQEVEKVFPELVQTDTEGYKSVSYGNLVAPLIQAVNELAKKIDTLTVSMNDLFDKYVSQQSQIDSLESRIQALESVK